MKLTLSQQDEEIIRERHTNGTMIIYEQVMPLLKYDETKDEWIYQEIVMANGTLNK